MPYICDTPKGKKSLPYNEESDTNEWFVFVLR